MSRASFQTSGFLKIWENTRSYASPNMNSQNMAFSSALWACGGLGAERLGLPSAGAGRIQVLEADPELIEGLTSTPGIKGRAPQKGQYPP